MYAVSFKERRTKNMRFVVHDSSVAFNHFSAIKSFPKIDNVDVTKNINDCRVRSKMVNFSSLIGQCWLILGKYDNCMTCIWTMTSCFGPSSGKVGRYDVSLRTMGIEMRKRLHHRDLVRTSDYL